jgi:hypothetical protein
MSNSLLTPTAVTREALRILHQKCNFIGSVTRDYDSSYGQSGAKIGDTLKIRLPNQYTVRTGATLSTQDTTENSVSLQVNNQIGVDLNFTSVDLTLSLDDFSKRILDPAMSVLAANIESDVLTHVYKDVYASIWNNGSAATYNKALDTRVKLQNALAPVNDRTMLLDPQAMADVVKDTKTLFNDGASISKQFKEGGMGRVAGYDWYENTMMPSHTVGDAASYVCNTSTGITSGTATITVSGGTGTFKAGDVITIAGVNRVHPETKVDTGQLQQFVVTADSTTSVSVSPTPITSGALKNVVINSAGASKAVTSAGTASTATQTGLAFQEGAFAFATADLLLPKGVDFAAREVMDGISMRIVRDYDITNDKFPCRLDVLYGYKTLRPQLACRFHNN